MRRWCRETDICKGSFIEESLSSLQLYLLFEKKPGFCILSAMQEIHQKLERLLQKMNLTEEESRLVVQAYQNPGLSSLELGKRCGLRRMSSYRTVEQLLEKGFLQISKDRGKLKRAVMAIPLQDIAKRVDRKSATLLRFASEIRDIDRFLRYPGVSRSPSFDVQKLYADEAREAFFDLHYEPWDEILFLGDFDTQVDNMGFDFEDQWIQRRVQKGRKARGVFTQEGQVTKDLARNNRKELRTSIVKPHLVQNQWFCLFPELRQVYLFQHNKEENPNWNLLKIISPEISKMYSDLVNLHV